MCNLKNNTNKCIYKAKTDSQTQRTTCGCPGEGGWEREGLQVWDWQMEAAIYRVSKHQGPRVQHSLPCDEP